MKKIITIITLLLGMGSALAQKASKGNDSINEAKAPLIVLEGNPINLDENGEPAFIMHKNAKGDKVEKTIAPINLDSLNEKKIAKLIDTNTHDIESITILKDAAANAIWGRFGKSGVIEVKVKNPRSVRKWQADDVIVATVHDWDDIHTPIVHATVKEITKDGRVIGETSTNEMGFFQLRLVAPENYIQITHNDYQSWGPFPTNKVGFRCHMMKRK